MWIQYPYSGQNSLWFLLLNNPGLACLWYWAGRAGGFVHILQQYGQHLAREFTHNLDSETAVWKVGWDLRVVTGHLLISNRKEVTTTFWLSPWEVRWHFKSSSTILQSSCCKNGPPIHFTIPPKMQDCLPLARRITAKTFSEMSGFHKDLIQSSKWKISFSF